MKKFEDFDLDLRENKINMSDEKSPKGGGPTPWISISLEYCTTVMSKLGCGPTGNCNITKISKCTGR